MVTLFTSHTWRLACCFLFCLLPSGFLYAQCIQANGHSTQATPFLASVLAPAQAYDLSDGNTTTAATLRVDGLGLATLNVNFDKRANPGDSIIVMFGVPTANILDWGSLGGATMTPYSDLNGTGTASNSFSVGTLSFILTVGANSLARIAIPVTSAAGAQSLRIEWLGIGFALNKQAFIYDVAVKPGPVRITSPNPAFLCAPGGTADFTGEYTALASAPIEVTWYQQGGTLLQTESNRTGTPVVTGFTTPNVTTTTTFYVQETWQGCNVLSDPVTVTVNVRAPLVPDISISCGPPPTLSTLTTGAEGTVNYTWTAANGGNIVSGANTATPEISGAGDYTVTITDANGCSGTVTETFTQADCQSLPVELIAFTVAKAEKTTLLRWVTAAEVNNERFDIERSRDGKQWQLLGTVARKGAQSSYTFVDANPEYGLNIYRLKMIDTDGLYAYSSLVSHRFEAHNVRLRVYPNPASHRLHLDGFDTALFKEARLLDLKGTLRFHTRTLPSEGISLEKLGKGTYILQISLSDNSTVTRNIVIAGGSD